MINSNLQIERHVRYSRTKLVSRHNRKKCIVCGRLCINMGDHVHSVHKIDSDDQYQYLVKSAPVVPACFIRNDGRKRVMLEGEELSEAHLKNDSEVQKQQEALEKLKKLRGEITELSNKIGEARDPEEYHKLKTALQSLDKNYKMERYKDHRVYSETTQK